MQLPFLLARAGAGAALIGLLFVAVSIALEVTTLARAAEERQTMASSSYTPFVNAFFIWNRAVPSVQHVVWNGFPIPLEKEALL